MNLEKRSWFKKREKKSRNELASIGIQLKQGQTVHIIATERQPDKETNTQKDTQTHRLTGKPKQRQKDIQRKRHIGCCTRMEHILLIFKNVDKHFESNQIPC